LICLGEDFSLSNARQQRKMEGTTYSPITRAVKKTFS
jgi:hypothetical protein